MFGFSGDRPYSEIEYPPSEELLKKARRLALEDRLQIAMRDLEKEWDELMVTYDLLAIVGKAKAIARTQNLIRELEQQLRKT